MQVLFTRGEDVSQRLYYYVCELQRCGKLAGPRPLIFDIAHIDRPSSHRYTEAALRELAQQLRLTDPQLRTGIARANALRALFSDLRRSRRAAGSVYEKIVRASLFADVAPAISALNGNGPPQERRRVVLGGSSPPDQRIHQLIESSGGFVAGEFYDRNLERLGGAVEGTAADPRERDLARVVAADFPRPRPQGARTTPAGPRGGHSCAGGAVVVCAGR